MPNILICNNSAKGTQDISSKILRYCKDQVGALIYFSKEEALLSFLEESSPEPSILIIDLEFCENGLRVAERSIKTNPWIGIIFYSPRGKWDLNVYEIDHAYGLAIDFSKDKLTVAIAKAINKIDKTKSEIIPIKENGIIHPVSISAIQYLEKDRRIINIHTEEQAYSQYMKFDELKKEGSLPFVRCHNSFVVNFSHVKAMKDSSFIMRNGVRIPISRNRRNQTREEFEAYITGSPVNNFHLRDS